MMKNEFGQLQAKLNLNIEAEPAPAAAPAGQAPTFVEKPKIVTREDGKLIMMIVRYRAEFKSECVWSFKETTISETSVMKLVHEKVADFWESRVELTVEDMSPRPLICPLFTQNPIEENLKAVIAPSCFLWPNISCKSFFSS